MSSNLYSDTLSNAILNRFMILHKIQAYPLKTGKEYPSWAIEWDNCLGVIVPYDGDEINEDFNNVTMMTIYPIIPGLEERQYLSLLTSDDNAKAHFASICESFVDPGDGGHLRKELIADPRSWWASWKDLIGNSSSEHSVHSVLGELVVLLYLKRNGYDVEWSGPNSSTHDITSENVDFEVKSSLSRYYYRVRIAGEHQLKIPANKTLKLFFCRLEESLIGVSIQGAVEALVREGYSEDDLLRSLKRLGIKKGSHLFTTRYSILELLSFDVDSDFPMITDESFINHVMPKGTSHISYDVDLEILDKTSHEIPVF